MKMTSFALTAVLLSGATISQPAQAQGLDPLYWSLLGLIEGDNRAVRDRDYRGWNDDDDDGYRRGRDDDDDDGYRRGRDDDDDDGGRGGRGGNDDDD